MKKVLIVTHRFPPHPAVASLRPAGLKKYLPEFGWDATILTSAVSGGARENSNIIETPQRESSILKWGNRLFKLNNDRALMAQITELKTKLHVRSEKSVLDFLLAAIGEVTAYPDPQKGWRKYAVKAGIELLKQHTFDAIISTSPPATSHIIARELREYSNLPWIADFRDLWTQNYYYPYSPLRRMIEGKLELKTLGSADVLVSVSDPAVEDLRRLHIHKPVYCIQNGFDPAEINRNNRKLTDKFTITYTGNLYPGKQNPAPLFGALHNLIDRGDMDSTDIEVRFYGSGAGWIDIEADRYGLSNIVKQYGVVSRELSLDKQRETQLLLLLKWNDEQQRGVYTAKVFEYLAAGRPILAVGGFHDVVDDLLTTTGAGVCGYTSEDVMNVLLPLYHEYKAKGAVCYGGDREEINKYSHYVMARKFAGIFESLTGVKGQ